MLVCDVSAIDRLLDMYGENLVVYYKKEKYRLYLLREHFVDENIECSLDNYIATSHGIKQRDGDQIVVFIDPHQTNDRDDILGL